MLGQELDWSILDTRLAAFLPSLLLTALFFGGNEEPGWRGFALPRLQDRFLARAVHAGVRRGLGALGTRPSCSPPMMQATAWAPAACSCSPRSRCSASSGRWTTRALRERLKRRMHLVPCAHDGAQPNPCRCGLSSRRPQDNRLPQARSARVHPDRAAKGRPAQAQGRRGAGSDVEGCA